MHDVIIIGGGVIGCRCRWSWHGRVSPWRFSIRGNWGRRQSWAGAGILPPGNPARAATTEARLRCRKPRAVGKAQRAIARRNGNRQRYRRCGGMEVRLHGEPEDLDGEIATWRSEGVEVESLAGTSPHLCEPELSPRVVAAYRLPEMGQVRNPRHLKALIAACAAAGVLLKPGTPAIGLNRSAEKVSERRTPDGPLLAGQFRDHERRLVAPVAGGLRCHLAIRPMRGQMVLLSAQPSPIRNVINVGPRYLVPRPDGRILVGSTEEGAGFDKRNTAGGGRGLIEVFHEPCSGARAGDVRTRLGRFAATVE